jgi:hypothetical protein
MMVLTLALGQGYRAVRIPAIVVTLTSCSDVGYAGEACRGRHAWRYWSGDQRAGACRRGRLG